MEIASHSLISKKIPVYASQFKNEYLFIRGINKEFKYIVLNINDVTRGLFQNHRVTRIKKLIKRFLLAQERGRLQDTSNFVLERDDVDNLIKIDNNFNNFCQFIKYLKDFCEEEYIEPYPGFHSIYGDFKLFLSKFKIRNEKVIYGYIDSDSDSDSDIDFDFDFDIDSDFDFDFDFDFDRDFDFDFDSDSE